MEDTQKLIDAINQLNERLKVVEGTAKDEPEGMRERQGRERDERKEKNETERYLKKNGAKATPTNSRRYEEIKHRYSETQALAQGVQKARSKPDDPSVVYAYFWKDGKIHQVALLCKSQPSEIV